MSKKFNIKKVFLKIAANLNTSGQKRKPELIGTCQVILINEYNIKRRSNNKKLYI